MLNPADTVTLGGWGESNGHIVRGYQPDGTTSGGAGGPCLVNCNNEYSIYGFHPGGANVAFADGSVRLLRAASTAGVVAGLITRSGGEVVNAD